MYAQEQSGILRERGVLHVRLDYFQTQDIPITLALLPGGTKLQPLTKVYEWWIDAENPYRFRRSTTEIVKSLRNLLGADGSDGESSWWIVDRSNGIIQPVRNEGKFPLLANAPEGYSEVTLAYWLSIFTREGVRALERMRRQEAVEVSRREQEPWGWLIDIRRVEPKTGHIRTSTVMLKQPHVRLGWVDLDNNGKLFGRALITKWEWLESTKVQPEFWTTPPTAASMAMSASKAGTEC